MAQQRIKSVDKGDYLKRKEDSKTVYKRGGYDRSSKKFEIISTEDTSKTLWMSGETIVYTGFTY